MAVRFQDHKPITIQGGDDVVLSFTLLDSAGDAVNLTGSTINWRLYPALNKSQGLRRVRSTHEVTVDGVITLATSGTLTVTIADTDTDDLVGRFFDRIKVTDSSANETTFEGGLVFVRENFDRSPIGMVW